MPTLDEIRHRTTPVGKILGVIDYLAENDNGNNGGDPVTWSTLPGKPDVIAAGANVDQLIMMATQHLWRLQCGAIQNVCKL